MVKNNFSFRGIAIILLTIGLLFTVGFSRLHFEKAKDVYIVYLGGAKIGLLENKDGLYDLINEEQKNIKSEFGVDRVYPPADLEIVEYKTYSEKIKTPEEIYDEIEKESTFTIKGYTITIRPEEGEPKYINILNKEDLEPAFRDAISAFVSLDDLDAYLKDNQIEITDTGKTIENIYFDERITVKENFLGVNDDIITNKDDLTKYLLFGTLEPQEEYIVKDGDTIENVAYNNELSNEELLIANPNLSSVNSLLSEGQVLNIGLIDPLFTIVEEAEVVEDIEKPYNTITESNSQLYDDESYVKQEGIKGVDRTTAKIQYKNGEVMNLVVSKTVPISEAVDKIVVKGTKPSYNFSNIPPAASSTDWGWPTISPYVITSYFGYRWGRLHGGIDISGSGYGSPIYSATDGVVTEITNNCSDKGYYGSSCGAGFGNSVVVQSSSGYIIYYAHIKKSIAVSVGQSVTKGQLLGYMGSSGSSTGTHLHFEIRDSSGSSKLNPCKVAFAC